MPPVSLWHLQITYQGPEEGLEHEQEHLLSRFSWIPTHGERQGCQQQFQADVEAVWDSAI